MASHYRQQLIKTIQGSNCTDHSIQKYRSIYCQVVIRLRLVLFLLYFLYYLMFFHRNVRVLVQFFINFRFNRILYFFEMSNRPHPIYIIYINTSSSIIFSLVSYIISFILFSQRILSNIRYYFSFGKYLQLNFSLADFIHFHVGDTYINLSPLSINS